MELSVIQISHVIFPDRSSSFFSSGTKLSSLEFIHGVWSGVHIRGHIRALVSTILLQSLDYCKTKYQDDNQTGHQQKHMWASCLLFTGFWLPLFLWLIYQLKIQTLLIPSDTMMPMRQMFSRSFCLEITLLYWILWSLLLLDTIQYSVIEEPVALPQ